MLVRKNMEINEHKRLFQLYTQTKFKVKEQLIVGKDMEVNEHERLFQLYTQTKFKVKEQLIVRKDMEVNEHETITNFTHRQKSKKQNRRRLSQTIYTQIMHDISLLWSWLEPHKIYCIFTDHQ